VCKGKKMQDWDNFYFKMSAIFRDHDYSVSEFLPGESALEIDFLKIVKKFSGEGYSISKDIDSLLSDFFGDDVAFVREMAIVQELAVTNYGGGLNCFSIFDSMNLPSLRGIYMIYVLYPDTNPAWKPDTQDDLCVDLHGADHLIPLYFGVSEDLNQRFKNHHRLDEIAFLEQMGLMMRFSYFTDKEFYRLPENLYGLESKLIKAFRPILNDERCLSLGKEKNSIQPLNQIQPMFSY